MRNTEVILVDHEDREKGAMEKMEAHRRGLLHRAFSIFIFNEAGEVLLQQRAEGKYHSGGLWANACCGHPAPGEDTTAAAHRRLQEELGMDMALVKAFDFTYRSEFSNGLTEHEFDHVFAGRYEGPFRPDPSEVQSVKFVSIAELDKMLDADAGRFTAWFLIAYPLILQWRKETTDRDPFA